jgi:hypothetical protein
MCFGVGSRRRSASQVSDLIDAEGVTRARLFTLNLASCHWKASRCTVGCMKITIAGLLVTRMILGDLPSETPRADFRLIWIAV